MTPEQYAADIVDELSNAGPCDVREFARTLIADAVADAVTTVHEHYFDQRLRLANAEVLLEHVLARGFPLPGELVVEIQRFLENRL